MMRVQSSATMMAQTKALEWVFQEHTWVSLLGMTTEIEMEHLKVVE